MLTYSNQPSEMQEEIKEKMELFVVERVDQLDAFLDSKVKEIEPHAKRKGLFFWQYDTENFSYNQLDAYDKLGLKVRTKDNDDETAYMVTVYAKTYADIFEAIEEDAARKYRETGS